MIMTIGLEPDLKLVERLTFLQEDLGKILTHRGADSRWCRPEYITLPLLYIGQQEDDAVPEIAKIMAEVGREVSPFSMEVAGISAMPAPACPRLIEVGIASGKDCVEALHERLAKAFSMANFASDRRPYRATILLGRTVTYTDRVDLTDAMATSILAKPTSSKWFSVAPNCSTRGPCIASWLDAIFRRASRP